jgi:DNA-binding NarL/FixJ family response regulator
VSDPLPLYRRGMMATLTDAGFRPEAPEDLLRWIAEQDPRVILLTVLSHREWALMRQLTEADAELILVALLAEAQQDNYVRAIAEGAASAVPRNATPETVLEVFKHAVRGITLLPTGVVRALAPTTMLTEEQPAINDREIEWLRTLSRGATVADLARTAGYSERAMYRLLRDLYARLSVANRTEAVMQAARRGWV